MVTAKIDVGYHKVRRAHDLDELAAVLFPGNRNHQRTFVVLFVELKWAENEFLPALEPIADKHGIGHRTLQCVRAKLRRLGIIDRVCRFNPRHGHREGWVFSNRFSKSMARLGRMVDQLRESRQGAQESKDRCMIDLV